MNTVSIVLEWENAKGLEREQALLFLEDLGQRVTKPDTIFSHPVKLIVIFDEDIDRASLMSDFEDFITKYSNSINVSFVYTPETPYYEKKGVAAFYADTDIVVYADSDCTYSENWLADLIQPLADGNADLAAGFTQTAAGENYVERVCEVAWFFPTADPKDRLNKKFKNRFFANNFAITRAAIEAVPIPRISGSRSHGGFWMGQLEAQKLRVMRIPEAVASHKQYDTWSDFFGRAWLWGKDKDTGVSLKKASRGYRLLRAFTAFFELTAKFLRRFFTVGLKKFTWYELLPALLFGLAFQWTAVVAQILSALIRPVATYDSDYKSVLERSELIGDG